MRMAVKKHALHSLIVCGRCGCDCDLSKLMKHRSLLACFSRFVCLLGYSLTGCAVQELAEGLRDGEDRTEEGAEAFSNNGAHLGMLGYGGWRPANQQ